MKILKFCIIALGIVFLLIVLLSAATFVIVKHLKIKDMIEQEIEQQLGINITIQKLDYSPFLTHVYVEGITVHNPAGFDEKELAYINAIHFVWDPGDMVVLKKPNVYLLAVDVERLTIIKNRQGRVNIKELMPIRGLVQVSPDKTPFFFDVLVLSIGTVNYTEYTASGKKVHTYAIGMKDQAFVRLRNEDDVIKLIVYKAIQNTDIGKLIDFTFSPVLSGVSDTIGAAWGTARAGARSLFQIISAPLKLILGK